eukprot:gene3616-23172_t
MAKNNKFVMVGLPLVLMTIAGSIGIQEFAKLRIDSRERKAHKMTDDEIDKHTNRKKREFKLDAELDRLNTQVDIKVNFTAQR